MEFSSPQICHEVNLYPAWREEKPKPYASLYFLVYRSYARAPYVFPAISEGIYIIFTNCLLSYALIV